MKNNFFIEKNDIPKYDKTNLNSSNMFFEMNDSMVNDFVNQKVSLESLIENKLFKSDL